MTNKFRGDQRQAWGVTATFKDEETGDLLTLHREGKDALARACDDALAVSPHFRLSCISTPETIYRDLQTPLVNPANGRPPALEAMYLGRCGRPEMLHSQWIGRNRHGRDKRGWK